MAADQTGLAHETRHPVVAARRPRAAQFGMDPQGAIGARLAWWIRMI